MKHEITFKNGLLIQTKTGNVLNLNPQSKFTIEGTNDSFLLEDFKKSDYTPKNSDEKLEQLQKNHKRLLLEKIAIKGDTFIFKIGLGKRTKEDKEREYLFNAVLDEDLYIMSKKEGNWRMCNCICRSTNLIEGEIGFPFQEVIAQSLSELYANVVSTYFNQKRSTACNAFKDFYYPPFDDKPSLLWIKKYRPTRIDDTRKNVIKDFEKNEHLKEKI